jgi:hypothetical protein
MPNGTQVTTNASADGKYTVTSKDLIVDPGIISTISTVDKLTSNKATKNYNPELPIKITSIKSDVMAHANVTGKTIPNAKITIVFPDQSTQIVTSNSQGVFTAQSTYAWIENGEIKASIGAAGKTLGNFTPAPIGKLTQSLGFSTFGCFTYSTFNAPTGSTVYMRFSNGYITNGKVTNANKLNLFPNAAYLPSGELETYIISSDGHRSASRTVNFEQSFAPSASITKLISNIDNKTLMIDYWVAPSAQNYNVEFYINDNLIKTVEKTIETVVLTTQQKTLKSWGFS